MRISHSCQSLTPANLSLPTHQDNLAPLVNPYPTIRSTTPKPILTPNTSTPHHNTIYDSGISITMSYFVRRAATSPQVLEADNLYKHVHNKGNAASQSYDLLRDNIGFIGSRGERGLGRLVCDMLVL